MDSDDSLDLAKDQSFGEKKLILSGLVKKMKFLFLHNTRQLILYSNFTLEYHDPEKNMLKGVIKLSKDTLVQKKDEITFTVTNPDREFTFKALDVPAQTWVKEVNELIALKLM
jgi:hypothetical protein